MSGGESAPRPPVVVLSALADSFDRYDRLTVEQRAEVDDRRLVPVPELRLLVARALSGEFRDPPPEPRPEPRPQRRPIISTTAEDVVRPSTPLPGTVRTPCGIVLG